MTNVFPDRLRLAGRDYINQSIAFAQVRLDGQKIKIRLQAIEIMKRFEGDVNYGNGIFKHNIIHTCASLTLGLDPRGVLFYDSLVAFQYSRVIFSYEKVFDTPSNFVTIQINFRGQDQPKDFARVCVILMISSYT